MPRRYGENHPNARLSDEDVSLVLALAEAGLSYAEIAVKFECSKSGVASICQGRTRAYLTPRRRTRHGKLANPT